MDIFVIAKDELVDKLRSEFTKIGNIIPLETGNNDINSYAELFADDKEKILALNPSIINWNLPNKVLDKINNLQAICSSSAWIRYIDLDYCKTHKIAVTHTSGANSQSVAEYAIWMMFSLARQLPYQINNNWVKNGSFPQQTELENKTFGVIGLGNIGSRVAKLGSGLGMNVIYWNRSPKPTSYEKVNLDELLSRSDVVINCLEICPETQGILNKEKLNLMKPSAFFVSVLGGMGWGVQDDKYLIEMVSDNKIAGFAVENEHSGDWPTTFNGNVFVPIASDHNTNESDARVLEQWIEAIKSVGSTNQKFRVI